MNGLIDRVPGAVNESVAITTLADVVARDIIHFTTSNDASRVVLVTQKLHGCVTAAGYYLEHFRNAIRHTRTKITHPGLTRVDGVIVLLRPQIDEHNLIALEFGTHSCRVVVWIRRISAGCDVTICASPRAAHDEIGNDPCVHVAFTHGAACGKLTRQPNERSIRGLHQDRARAPMRSQIFSTP